MSLVLHPVFAPRCTDLTSLDFAIFGFWKTKWLSDNLMT
jgi:hypothetical protein